MEQAPHFGAIPSAGDVQKKKAQQVTDAEWREQFVEELCQPDALLRLQRLEQNDSAKADKIKAELFRMASRVAPARRQRTRRSATPPKLRRARLLRAASKRAR